NAWDKNGTGNAWMNIAAAGIGGAMGATIVAPAIIESSGLLISEVVIAAPSIYASVSDATMFGYMAGESAVSTGVNLLSRYWLGRMAITGGSLIAGTNLWNYRTNGGPIPKISMFGGN